MNRAIEHWDDERASDGGIVVTLHYGWSFDPKPYHEGVMIEYTDVSPEQSFKRVFSGS